jgi:hypothetical protein
MGHEADRTAIIFHLQVLVVQYSTRDGNQLEVAQCVLTWGLLDGAFISGSTVNFYGVRRKPRSPNCVPLRTGGGNEFVRTVFVCFLL